MAGALTMKVTVRATLRRDKVTPRIACLSCSGAIQIASWSVWLKVFYAQIS